MENNRSCYMQFKDLILIGWAIEDGEQIKMIMIPSLAISTIHFDRMKN